MVITEHNTDQSKSFAIGGGENFGARQGKGGDVTQGHILGIFAGLGLHVQGIQGEEHPSDGEYQAD